MIIQMVLGLIEHYTALFSDDGGVLYWQYLSWKAVSAQQERPEEFVFLLRFGGR